MKRRIELLSPAGDLERLKVTLLYGADAVYIGGQHYSLRANASNFSISEIREACLFAHSLNKKVYLTLNIVFHNEDIEGVEDYIKEVVHAGIDAFIVSDPFVIRYIKSNFPEVEVHLSTQNSTTNIEAVQFFKGEGIDRVVLARELSLEEIQEVIDKTGIDVEIFIHGAMCTFYSGRCTLSNYLTNRDSNRGGCSQVCRFAFRCGNEESKFTMATKDLNAAKYIGRLIDIGVASLKVEGRMRSLYYLATVIGCYRRIIDAYYIGKLDENFIEYQEKVLSRVANRETSAHYLAHEADETDQYYTGRQEVSNQDFLGLIVDYNEKNHIVTLLERNYFSLKDEVELFTPNGDIYSFVIEEMYNENMEPIEVARHPEEIIKLKVVGDIIPYSMLRKKVK